MGLETGDEGQLDRVAVMVSMGWQKRPALEMDWSWGLQARVSGPQEGLGETERVLSGCGTCCEVQMDEWSGRPLGKRGGAGNRQALAAVCPIGRLSVPQETVRGGHWDWSQLGMFAWEVLRDSVHRLGYGSTGLGTGTKEGIRARCRGTRRPLGSVCLPPPRVQAYAVACCKGVKMHLTKLKNGKDASAHFS